MLLDTHVLLWWLADDLVEAVEASGFRPRHHDDPFDRMLAQAQLEGLTLVTVDARLPSYDVASLSASA